MIHRQVKLSELQSFFLFGARGTGKSTLLRAKFPQDDYFWVDLLHPEQEMRYGTRPERLLDDWRSLQDSQKARGWLVIDEVQRVPKLLDVVHIGIEQHGIKFAMTGLAFVNPTVHSRSILCTVSWQYSSASSIPQAIRLLLMASIMVVPLPQKGSSTVSPTKENSLMQRFGNSRGKGAG